MKRRETVRVNKRQIRERKRERHTQREKEKDNITDGEKLNRGEIEW